MCERNSFKQEPPGLNSDGVGGTELLSRKIFNVLSYVIYLKTLLHIRRRETA